MYFVSDTAFFTFCMKFCNFLFPFCLVSVKIEMLWIQKATTFSHVFTQKTPLRQTTIICVCQRGVLSSVFSNCTLSIYNGNACHHRLLICRNSSIVICRLCILADLVNNVHAFCHMSESGILSIQIGTVRLHDKELGACTVRI